MKCVRRWFGVTLGAVIVLSGCGERLAKDQLIKGRYVCRETGDIMGFTPDGRYTYTIGGPSSDAWNGTYDYWSPDGEIYNELGHGLVFNYALSGHCFLWESPHFEDARKEVLIVTCGKALKGPPDAPYSSAYRVGHELRYVREPNDP